MLTHYTYTRLCICRFPFIRDLSVPEPPVDKPIQTCNGYHDRAGGGHQKREVARGGQVYYLYNRVNNI